MGTSTTTANLTVVIVLMVAVVSSTTAAAYTNHTVGNAAGWHFNATTNTTAANYSSWAAAQTFSLGDYIIFTTTSNQTVIQTYNETTYLSCTTDDAEDDDTFQFEGGNTEFSQALTVGVPLTIEGPNYYFSEADDGVQCQHGMAFEVVVSRGQGLPPSLNQPPPPPYIEPPPADSESPPVNIPGVQPKSDGGDGMRSGAIVRLIVYVCLCCFWYEELRGTTGNFFVRLEDTFGILVTRAGQFELLNP